MLNNMNIGMQCPTMSDLMGSPIAKFITLVANDCGYSSTNKELIGDHVHSLFLKAKSEASAADNPTYSQAMNGTFADEYWEAMRVEIAR